MSKCRRRESNPHPHDWGGDFESPASASSATSASINNYMAQQIERKTLLLIDGMNLLYRAFYVLPPMRTRAGFPTGGLYGFFLMCTKAIKEFRPDALFIALDKGKPFRTEWYPQYKATRQKPPEDLKVQAQHFEEFLGKMQLTWVAHPGLEADDIITTLSKSYQGLNWKVLVLSADRDLLQLISPHISLVVPEKGFTRTKIYTEELFEQEYGFSPSLFADFKALKGDPSDNIPGVPGIGEKTAAQLIRSYGSIEELYERISDIPEKWRNLLTDYKEQAFLGKKLVLLSVQSALKIPEPTSWSPDRASLGAALREYEFVSILKELELPIVSLEMRETLPVIQRQEQLLEDLISAPRIALMRLPQEHPLLPPTLCVGTAKGSGLISLSNGKTSEFLAKIWADPQKEKITFGIKELFRYFRKFTSAPCGQIFDVQLASFLLDSEQECGWKDILRIYHSLLSVPEAQYFGGLLFSLFSQVKDLIDEAGLMNVLQEIWIPFTFCLADMEDTGIRLDTSVLRELGKNLDHQLHQLEQTAYYLADAKFNLNSPKQVSQILFERLKLPRIKDKSTDMEVLEKLRERHPLIPVLIEYRTLSKFQSTYVDGLLSEVDSAGKVHTSFFETGTKTGRLSSREPNLQNIPIRTELGTALRRAFLPSSPGWVFLSADYSQMDLRILAHLSQDSALMKSFRKGMDIHLSTAQELFGVKTEEVTPEIRRRAKSVNFGLVYGISDFGLAQQLGVSRAEAKNYLERYFSAHPGVKEYMRKTVETAREKGYVTTILGRRRSIPGIRSENPSVRKSAERAALNTPVQGSTADFITLAMVRLHQTLPRDTARLLLQVHDELLLETRADALPEVAKQVKRLMEGGISLSIPVVVEQKVGENWGDILPISIWNEEEKSYERTG